ncbi:ATP-dependent DNA helicase [Granulicella tundricola]|uniref:DNA 5'-3' helicase n=1 Tax=Granulicella tundricola (strain ATCC BAA-1859 / DSM 23138 / MP5ACTX9) TaxID=1198114 RepID=E8X152_GRATM|nr:ATP-dependent DNA helicase [Granulicella tundricola]ADW67918.1 DEAD/DEAH box helicase domain protein [Granulicella tundricola MP5ACTX9]
MSTAPPIPSPTSARPKKLPTLHDFFAPGGILAKSSLAYEHRKGQYDMAKAVESALEDKRHLIVEAGTGTGKTLAYLLPALRHAREHNQRVIISTGTKNLQEQLYFKDIPFLESMLADDYGPLKVCYMKGRANYLCKHKLYALRDSPLLSGLEEIEQFHHITTWERTTPTGDRAELDHLPETSALWSKLDARTEACLGTTCPDWEQCFITQMRRKALESDLIIVNHHLFFADLNIKQQAAGAPDAGILPDASAVIFDEAHELEDIASNYFGIGLSNARIDELTRDVEIMLRAKQASSSAIESACAILKDRSKMFFASLPTTEYQPIGRMPFEHRADYLETEGDAYIGATNALKRLTSELEQVKNVEETKGLIKRTEDIRQHLKFLLESDDPNTVFWIERRAGGSGVRNLARGPAQQIYNTQLQATPIDVSTLLTTSLFDCYPTVVLTSATLTVAAPEGTSPFTHITGRLGLTLNRELVVPSHFNYPKQALLYLPPSMPDPREPDFTMHAVERIRRVLEITKGRAFVLFTSYSQMRLMHDRLLAELPYPLLLHGTAPRHVLLQQFRDTPNAVLFGTSSFWQGVDVQGEQLSCVIIDRLPFGVPTDPILKARMDLIASTGGKPFFDLQIPAAVITLKQGFGRLIRSLNDRGVLMLLDPRIQRQRYGKVFLDSLPPYTVTQSIEDVEAFFAAKAGNSRIN